MENGRDEKKALFVLHKRRKRMSRERKTLN